MCKYRGLYAKPLTWCLRFCLDLKQADAPSNNTMSHRPQHIILSNLPLYEQRFLSFPCPQFPNLEHRHQHRQNRISSQDATPPRSRMPPSTRTRHKADGMRQSFSPAKPSPNMKVPVELLHEIIELVARPHLNEIPNPHAGSIPRTTYHPTQSDSAQALQTLFNLCLTSHLLYEITLPILYREFALGYNDIPGDSFQPQIGQRMTAFARTLLMRRDLACLVKRAFLHPRLVGRMGAENIKMISALTRKRLSNDVLLLFGDQPPAVEMLIFALMPNLERLVFAGLYSWVNLPLAVREVAWKRLGNGAGEQTVEYGPSFTEAETIRRLEEEEQMTRCAYLPLPDEEDDDL